MFFFTILCDFCNFLWYVTIAPVLQLTDAIKQYVEEKVGNAVHNHGPLVKEVDVRMSVRGAETGRGAKLQRCEVGHLWNILLQINGQMLLENVNPCPSCLRCPNVGTWKLLM